MLFELPRGERSTPSVASLAVVADVFYFMLTCATCAGDVTRWTENEWSPALHDFVKHVMIKDIHNRPSGDDALKHALFASFELEPARSEMMVLLAKLFPNVSTREPEWKSSLHGGASGGADDEGADGEAAAAEAAAAAAAEAEAAAAKAKADAEAAAASAAAKAKAAAEAEAETAAAAEHAKAIAAIKDYGTAVRSSDNLATLNALSEEKMVTTLSERYVLHRTYVHTPEYIHTYVTPSFEFVPCVILLSCVTVHMNSRQLFLSYSFALT